MLNSTNHAPLMTRCDGQRGAATAPGRRYSIF